MAAIAPKFPWWGTVKTLDEAQVVVAAVAKAFYLLAVLQGAVGYFIGGLWALVDAGLYAILALLLQKYRSRAAAVALLILSSIAMITTGMNMLGISKGGTNIVLALIVFWASIRAVQATFALRRLQSSANQPATS